MSEKEIREKLQSIIRMHVSNKPERQILVSHLVEHLLDLIEDVAACDRDTAYESGYAAGFDDGGIAMQYNALDEGPFMEDEE